MKRLHYVKANALSQLHGELLAAFPTLATTARVEGLDNDIWLTVPDDADEAAIGAIVAAHTPAAVAPLPARPTNAQVNAIRAVLAVPNGSAATTQQLTDAFKAVVQVIRYRSGDL